MQNAQCNTLSIQPKERARRGAPHFAFCILKFELDAAKRRRGAASILAMMFLVIFGSLSAAMAIIAQGNLATADSHMKINRSLAGAETAMEFLIFRVNQVTATVETEDGLIDGTNAPALWDETRYALLASLQGEFHNIEEPFVVGSMLHVGPIAIAPGEPTFTATFTPHPLAGENYNADYYQRPPYSQMNPPVSNSDPLDTTWIRVRVTATDGEPGSQISRTIQMDFKLDKKIRFAILSKSRVMIGQNVLIDGPVGSRFTDVHLEHGHPIQVSSDFRGLETTLDEKLDILTDTLIAADTDGDNRLNLSHDDEAGAISDSALSDNNGDGFVDEYDLFLWQFDNNGDGAVTQIELGADTDIRRAQLLELIDTFGDPTRDGYNDGVIDSRDNYSKMHGQIKLTASLQAWQAGAANYRYQDFLQGMIDPDSGEAPLTFQANDTSVHEFDPDDFDTSGFRSMATGDLEAQAQNQADTHDPDDPDSPKPLGNTEFEEVPFGAAYPYDYYHRPVYENMTFTNVFIPKGTNALFRNCTFIGVTYVETTSDNDDPNYNFAGTLESDGSPRFPDKTAVVDGNTTNDTKTVANNIRFDDCTFEGVIISGADNGSQPQEYTHFRNKINFTGKTRFDIENSTNISETEKALFMRSTILTPHYSIEMGTFIDPTDADETVELSGVIVTGLLDARGQVKIDGTLLTTFEPINDSGPVIGDTSPQFNTTLGYFPSSDGDLEAELPGTGLGVIHVTYNEDLALPDGILGPIEIRPVLSTYFESTGAAPVTGGGE